MAERAPSVIAEVSIQFLRQVMQKIWKKVAFKIIQIRLNTFNFIFVQIAYWDWVLDNGPSSFDDMLLVVRPWSQPLFLSNDGFGMERFWVQVRGLPRECWTFEVGQRVVSRFSRWPTLQIRELADSHERLFRILVELDLTAIDCP